MGKGDGVDDGDGDGATVYESVSLRGVRCDGRLSVSKRYPGPIEVLAAQSTNFKACAR